jgi:diguanylate cyclase (GGDEF)-like protein
MDSPQCDQDFRLLKMLKPSPALLPSEPDSAILATIAQVERISRKVLLVIAAVNIVGWFVPAMVRLIPGGWQPMKAESVLSVVLSALCLLLSEPGQSKWMHRLSMLLAVVVGLMAAAVLIKYRLDDLAGAATQFPGTFGSLIAGRMSQQSALAFGLLSCTLVLIRARGRLVVRVADLLTFGLCLTILTIVSGHIFGTYSIFRTQATIPTSPQTLLCLALLTAMVLTRRAEDGIFSIFIGRGIGARVARILSPILLALPYLREEARARLVGASSMPAHYVTAVLASMAAVVSICLLLYLAWRINAMEMEIHTLSLRDELTGLNNLRGFHLLAEQALRLSQRSKLPFSVLYIDLDNLKQTNDTLGHQAGSSFLVETSEILRTTFRESDVLGRIGGDEFAVAGHFGKSAVASATKRLEACCVTKNAEEGRRFELSFSVGHVTSADTDLETLDELLMRADEAMYKVKRSKKDRIARGAAAARQEVHGGKAV